MVNNQQVKSSTSNHHHPPENGDDDKKDSLFSPRFKSVVAMAGWDEDALLSAAALIVDDTPDRLSKRRKPLYLPNRNSPPPLTNSNSRSRKRRAQRRSLHTSSMPVVVLRLDDDDDNPPAKQETENGTTMKKIVQEEDEVIKEIGAFDCKSQGSPSNPVIPCIDRLREELSCAICLEICYEPSTTPCGHSFCKNCLRSAADKCGKRCPKCRQFISNGRSCTVNTVLWNTIQLLFPQEIEARKASIAPNCREAQSQNAARVSLQHGSVEVLLESLSHSPNTNRRSSRHTMRRRSRAQPSDTLIQGDRRTNFIPSQDEDAALALRMQREEFMGVFGHRRSDDASQRSPLAMARANLRAMASRATSTRLRGRTA